MLILDFLDDVSKLGDQMQRWIQEHFDSPWLWIAIVVVLLLLFAGGYSTLHKRDR